MASSIKPEDILIDPQISSFARDVRANFESAKADVEALIETATFQSRAAFEAYTVPQWLQQWSIQHLNMVLRYRRDSNGTAITSANGVKGSPDGDCYLEHWGAGISQGSSSDNAAIQAAIDWRASKGGGVVYAAEGAIYRHDGATIEIKDAVQLVGIPGMLGRATSSGKAPLIRVYSGKGNSALPAFRLKVASGVIGISFAYPEQVTPAMVDPVSGLTLSEPHVYGYTIDTPGGDYPCDLVTLQDLMLSNSYAGINLNRVGQAKVARIYGQPISVGIRGDRWFDVNYISNVHFWPFNAVHTSPLGQWTINNGQAFVFGRVDAPAWTDCFCYGYKNAYVFTDFGSGSPWITISGVGVDWCKQPVAIESATHMVTFTDMFFIGTDPTKSVGVIVQDGPGTGVADHGRITFTNVKFWNMATAVVVKASRGEVTLNNCTNKRTYGAAASGNDVAQFLLVNEGAGARCHVNSGGAQQGTAIQAVSGTKFTWYNGIPIPEPISDATAELPGFSDPLSAQWTHVAGSAACFTSLAEGYNVDLSVAQAGSIARYALPDWLKNESGVFVFECELTTLTGGSGGNFSFRIMENTGNVGLWYALPSEAVPAHIGYKLSIPFIVRPTGGIVYFDISLNTGATTISVKNPKVYRTAQYSVDDRYLNATLGTNRFRAVDGIGLPLRYEGGRRVVMAPSAPVSGTFLAGERRIHPSPADGAYSMWRCVEAGSPGVWVAEGSAGVASAISFTGNYSGAPRGVRYFSGTEDASVAVGLPALGGTTTAARFWLVDTQGTSSRAVQTATEVFGNGTTRGRRFRRVMQDGTWHTWIEG